MKGDAEGFRAWLQRASAATTDAERWTVILGAWQDDDVDWDYQSGDLMRVMQDSMGETAITLEDRVNRIERATAAYRRVMMRHHPPSGAGFAGAMNAFSNAMAETPLQEESETVPAEFANLVAEAASQAVGHRLPLSVRYRSARAAWQEIRGFEGAASDDHPR